MYKLILISPDGDYVTELPKETIDECGDQSANMGSRWFFYPFHFIIKDNEQVNMNQRIVESPYGMEFLNGLSLKKAIQHIKENTKMYLQ